MLMRCWTLSLLLLLLSGACGCGVQRTLQVESDPPGALVYLNGDEVGRTPMRKNFVWYGTYDVQLRKEGYQTVTKEAQVWAPWWQVPPIDFFAELFPLPLEDKHALRYRMEPAGERQTDPGQILGRAVQTRDQLRGRGTRRAPATQRAGPVPTTQPSLPSPE